MIFYVENPKDYTHTHTHTHTHTKLLKLINKFSKMEGYKVNTQKLVASLCMNMSNMKNPLTIEQNISELTKEVKDIQ